MRVSTLFKLGVVGAIGVTIALVAASKSIDVNDYRDFIAQQVEGATGRKLTIAGPLELKIGLVPQLVATGVSLGNMATGSRPEMATVERIEAEIALIPLLSRQIQINRLILVNPDIMVETDAKGRANWSLGTTAPAPEATAKAPPTRFAAREIKIKNARLTWRDGKAGISRQLDIHKLVVLPENGASGPLNVTMKAQYHADIIQLSGVVGALATLGSGKPWPLQLKGSMDGAVVAIDGSATNPLAGIGLDFNLSAQGEELSHILRMVEMLPSDAPAIGPYKASGKLKDSAGRLAIEAVDIAIGKRDTALLSAKGNIADVKTLAGIDLGLTLETDNLAGLTRLAGAELPALGPLKLAGTLSSTPAGWQLAEIKGNLGASDLHGDLALALGGQRPRLTGGLRSTTLAAADLAARGKPKPGDGRLFPASPLPQKSLRMMDADLSLAITKLALGKVVVSDLAIEARLANGRLTVKPVKGLLAGGTVDGEVTLDSTGTASARMAASRIDLGQLAKDSGSSGLSGGLTDARLDLRGKGDTVRAVMASLSGTALATVGEGSIQSKAMDWAGGDVLTQVLGSINPLVKTEDTALKCAVANFVVKNGTATATKGIAAETSKMTVVGSGTIDLRTEAIDFGLTPRARDGLGISLSGAMAGMTRVRGTLGAPVIAIDEMGTARTAASAGAAIATGGLSLLGEMLYDRVSADSTPCQTALGQTAPGKPVRKGK